MNKKTYTAPEAEIEKFTIYCDNLTVSNGLEGAGSDNEFGGAGDWEF